MKAEPEENPVVTNIRMQVEKGEFNGKVEEGDPSITEEEQKAILDRYVNGGKTLKGKLCNHTARSLMWAATKLFNASTVFEGMENLEGFEGGAIITSNHFNPMDNSIVRQVIFKAYHERIYIVSQETNFAMTGFLGFFMKYADTIPISGNLEYMRKYFDPAIAGLLKRGRKVLIYPEQEMWINYRKPRPVKRGAYYYAARSMVPVISCFVEMRTLTGRSGRDFYRNRYIMHVLPMIRPDPEKSVRENSRAMMQTDYDQKKEAYEMAYNKKLTYDFEPWDIAGWIPPDEQIN